MAEVDNLRQRSKKPKVRTGCRSCKIRRVKCDEEKPSCRRCYSTNRICGGYESFGARSDHGRAMIILPRLHNESPAQAISNLDLNSVEAYNFDYFRSKTLRVLPGITRSLPWEHLMLQISQKEPAVLSAAIAVGSIHRSFESDRWPGLIPDDLELQRTISQQQYIKAMRLLRDRLADPEDPQRAEIALIGCFLFICLELIQSDITAALSHLRSGLRILREQSKKDDNRSGTTLMVKRSPTTESVIDHFSSLFARLDYQSTMFGEDVPQLLVIPASNNTSSPLWMPAVFANIQEVRQYLDALATSVFRFRGHVVHEIAHGGSRPLDRTKRLRARWAHMPYRQPSYELDARITEEQNALESSLSEWKIKIDVFTAKNIKSFSPEDVRDLKVARIHHFSISLLLKETLPIRQMFFDQYIDEFREMIDLAEALNDDYGLLPSFSIDMGTDAPLYYLACKCRDSAIRHRAVQLLLASRRREGMWDGHITGQFVQRIVAIEEAGATGPGPYFTCDQIPETSRYSDISLGFSDDGNRGRLYFGRFKHESTGEWVVHETEFDFNPVQWRPIPVAEAKIPRSALGPEDRTPVPELTFTASFHAFQDRAVWIDPRFPISLPMKPGSLNGFPTPSAAGLASVRRQQIVQRAQAAKDRLRSGAPAETAGKYLGNTMASYQEEQEEKEEDLSGYIGGMDVDSGYSES